MTDQADPASARTTRDGEPEVVVDRTTRDAPPQLVDRTTRDGAPQIAADGAANPPGSNPPGSNPSGGDSGYARVNLPPTLARRMTVDFGLPPTGGEADLLVCHQGDRQVVVKLYRQYQPRLDTRMLTEISRAHRDHVVQVFEHGEYDGYWWEVQEYVELGSLHDLGRREGPALPLPLLREILDELVVALEHLHGMGIVHRDIKPSNILVRTREPLDLVLADFGLAVLMAENREMRSGSRTSAYAAPEASWGDTSTGRDWWSLGMTLLELGTGSHPFQRDDGSWLEDAQIGRDLATRPIDIDGMPDPRWRLLLSGLLTRDPEHRWGGEQVHEWCLGGDPDVHDEVAAPVDASPRFTFCGTAHTEPGALAEHMAQEWPAAAQLILGLELPALQQWTEQIGIGDRVGPALQACTERRHHVDRLVAGLLVALDPGLVPRFRGHVVLPGRLPALAAAATAAPGREREAVDALLTSGALQEFSAAPGCQGLAELDRRWQQETRRAEQLCEEPGLPREVVETLLPVLPAQMLQLTSDPTAAADLARKAARIRKSPPPALWFSALTELPGEDLADHLVLTAGLPRAEEEHRDHLARERARKEHENEQRRLEDERRRLELERAANAERLAQQQAQAAARAAALVAAQQAKTEAATIRQKAKQEQAARRLAARSSAAAPRLARDVTIKAWCLILLISGVGPWYLGGLWLQGKLHVGVDWWDSRHPATASAAWRVALHGSYSPVVRYLFGALVVLGAAGVLMLLPPWRGRHPRRIALALALAAGLVLAPVAATATADRYYSAAQKAYLVGPISPSKMAPHLCGRYWTSNQPISGSFHRYALASSSAGGACTSVVGFSGWRRIVAVPAGRSSTFTDLAYYPGTVVVRQEVDGKPGQLLGISDTTRKVAWKYTCRDRAKGFPSNVQFLGVAPGTAAGSAALVRVTCRTGTVDLDPSTGRTRG